MRIGGFDFRTTTTIVALAVVVGLAVPVVSAPGSVGLAGTTGSSVGHTVTTTAPDALAPHDDLQVSPTPQPVPSGFEQAAQQSPSPDLEPAPERTTSGTSVSPSIGSAGRPAATAPAKPLAAQPAPIVSSPSTSECPAAITGTTPGAPSRTSPLGVAGTTSTDLQSFAQRYNAIRVANCLAPVPFANIRYDSCMEDRLFWMAEDPSTDPMSAWGHIGSVRSDGVPSVGCDGNLAGGTDNGGTEVAQKWWDSSGHRTSLYKPTYTGGTGNVCIVFAMTHGGVPNEPYSFTRAAARWVTC